MKRARFTRRKKKIDPGDNSAAFWGGIIQTGFFFLQLYLENKKQQQRDQVTTQDAEFEILKPKQLDNGKI